MKEELKIQAGYEKVAQRQKRRKQKKARRITLLLFGCFLVLLISLSCTIFFNIKTISVTGSSQYTSEEIIQKSELSLGENLFRIGRDGARARLKLSFPYVEDVKFQLHLPSTLEINIIEAKERGALLQEDGYVILSENNRVLKQGEKELKEGIRLIKGITPENCIIGNYIVIDDKEKSDLLQELYTLLEKYNFTDITLLDIDNVDNIKVNIGEKRDVLLGNAQDLSYKIDVLSELNQTHLEENESVLIDCRDPKRVVVSPKK